MTDFTKLAGYLDSFKKDDVNYDLACYIKAKIAEDLQDKQTINNGEEDDLQDNDITMSTPEQQAAGNQEGELMGDAFPELEVLNKLKEEKEEVQVMDERHDPKDRPALEVATEQAFGDNSSNQKQASFFELLQRKIKK
jgi:hypothetical protein